MESFTGEAAAERFNGDAEAKSFARDAAAKRFTGDPAAESFNLETRKAYLMIFLLLIVMIYFSFHNFSLDSVTGDTTAKRFTRDAETEGLT